MTWNCSIVYKLQANKFTSENENTRLQSYNWIKLRWILKFRMKMRFSNLSRNRYQNRKREQTETQTHTKTETENFQTLLQTKEEPKETNWVDFSLIELINLT
jgi:hypothetical protein